MGYWDETDRILSTSGAPTCPYCGEAMFPQDDHGRFTCLCGGARGRAHGIPQIDTADMTNQEKAQIAPINRLDAEPTAAEQALLAAMLSGDDYRQQMEVLRRERQED